LLIAFEQKASFFPKRVGSMERKASKPLSMDPPFEAVFKILLVGDSGVGKTSLLLRFTDDRYTEGIPSSLGADSKEKQIQLLDGRKVQLDIWDTAGQEKMGFLTSSYYRGAQGVMLVFDITKKDSYNNLRHWLEDTGRYAVDSILKLLVGNKSDLDGQRVISPDEAQSFAEDIDVEYVETSAKEGDGVEEAFMKLAEKIKNKGITRGPDKAKKAGTLLLDPAAEKKSKSVCNI